MIEKGFKFIDLFCGIGGFHQAMSSLGGECVFASDIDKHCQETYFENYGIRPIGDITKVEAADIPSFNVLCAGFPCQAFSLAGKKLGFADETRGTLFFDVIRIAKHHKPEYMLLENVKNLANHDEGRTWNVIYNTIREIGYNVLSEPVIFSPHYLGIPQTRERVFIMCVREDIGTVPEFKFDKKDIPECDLHVKVSSAKLDILPEDLQHLRFHIVISHSQKALARIILAAAGPDMEIVSAVSGFLAASGNECTEVSLIRESILREPHILMDTVCAFLDSDATDGRIKGHNAFYQFLNDGVEMSARLLVLTFVSIEPLLVVVNLKIPEE